MITSRHDSGRYVGRSVHRGQPIAVPVVNANPVKGPPHLNGRGLEEIRNAIKNLILELKRLDPEAGRRDEQPRQHSERISRLM